MQNSTSGASPPGAQGWLTEPWYHGAASGRGPREEFRRTRETMRRPTRGRAHNDDSILVLPSTRTGDPSLSAGRSGEELLDRLALVRHPLTIRRASSRCAVMCASGRAWFVMVRCAVYGRPTGQMRHRPTTNEKRSGTSASSPLPRSSRTACPSRHALGVLVVLGHLVKRGWIYNVASHRWVVAAKA